MRATCWAGRNSVELREVPDPTILNSRDAIIRVTSTAICGSDLHLYDGYVPAMRNGDILGHEFVGEVVEVGPGVRTLSIGDRVVVPFPIACGACGPCLAGLTSACDNSNPNAPIAEKLLGHATAGIFGYSHLMGGYPGGQAEYVRVPFADVGPLKVEDDLPDEKVLLLSDIMPTGWMAAEMCGIVPGDTVAVWGAGPVGVLAMISARIMGAGRVIAFDRFGYRLRLAAEQAGAEPVDYTAVHVPDVLREVTAGRGPDACIDAAGMEAHHPSVWKNAVDRAKQAARIQTDRGHALREAILTCRSGGTVAVAGGYGGFVDSFPIGAVMNRGLTIRSAQAPVDRYQRTLSKRVRNGTLDPSVVITHRLPLSDVSTAYETFKHKRDGCEKVVLLP